MEYRENYVKYKDICDSIVTDIYRIELSIKFYITGFLDYTEVIENGFCAYTGDYRPHYFPPCDVTDSNVSYTMLTVNFHGDKQTRHPCVWGHISIPTSRAPSATHGSMDEHQPKQNPLIPQLSTYFEREPKMIYKLEFPETIQDYEPMPDYHLKKYIQSVRKLLNCSENYTRKEKLQALAKFVACNLSGHENEVPSENQFDKHITELKEKLMTNYIPLGYVRMGTMLERALLFKVLADKVRIPCTLERGDGNLAWNEVCIDVASQEDSLQLGSQSNFVLCIVDLVNKVGTLMVKETEAAQRYCLGSKYDSLKKYQNYNYRQPFIRVSSVF